MTAETKDPKLALGSVNQTRSLFMYTHYTLDQMQVSGTIK